jgi:two-component system NarL family sensor kinase
MPPRPKDLRILYAIAQELNGAADVRTALERMLAMVAGMLRLHAGWIWLFDPETQAFYNAASFNLPPYLRDPVRMAGTWCQCTELFREGKLSPRNVDVIECSRLAPAVQRKLSAQTGGFQYHASVPLYFRDHALGIMNLTGPKWRRLTQVELRLLDTIALQAGATIERARLADGGARLARVEERTRLAREIHDTLVQRLTAIGLQLEGALRRSDKSAGRGSDEVSRALAMTREGIDEARQSVLSLRGVPLVDKPLAQAIETLARAFTSRTGIPVRVDVARAELPARVEMELIRIAQEALTNIGKHARATDVAVKFSRRGTSAHLRVSDNGVGFRAKRTTVGQGLIGMRERADLIGASLSIERPRAGGTTVSVKVKVPLTQTAS